MTFSNMTEARQNLITALAVIPMTIGVVFGTIAMAGFVL